jgi:hypothetical protein
LLLQMNRRHRRERTARVGILPVADHTARSARARRGVACGPNCHQAHAKRKVPGRVTF